MERDEKISSEKNKEENISRIEERNNNNENQ
jgi:hypothetical protein